MGLGTTYFFACLALFLIFALLRPMADGEEPDQFSYAGFWQRFGAFVIDGAILGWLFSCYAIFLMIDQNYSNFEEIWHNVKLPDIIAPYLVIFLYFVLFESSELKATPGKMVMGICVVDTAGNRIVLGQAIVRHVYHIFSYMTCFMGFALAGVTRQKQALHDVMAKTLLVENPVSNSSLMSVAGYTRDRRHRMYATARSAVQPRRYDPRF